MEVESFEDEGIAKLLNDWFVSIKVNHPFMFFYCFEFLYQQSPLLNKLLYFVPCQCHYQF